MGVLSAVVTSDRGRIGITPFGWRRAGAITGALFAVLAVMFGFHLGHVTGWSDTESGAQLSSYISHHKSDLRTSLFMGGLNLMIFLCFTVLLSKLLRDAEGQSGFLAPLAFAASIAAVAVIFLSFAAGAAMVQVAPASAHSSLEDLWFLTTGADGLANFPFALLIATTSFAVLRHGGLPKWTAWFGFLIAIVEIGAAVAGGGPGPAPIALWSLVVAGAMLIVRRPRPSSPTP